MIVEFAVKNYRSIREEQVLSLVADETDPNRDACSSSLSDVQSVKVLHSAMLCGPNASGKTNVIVALNDFKNFVLHSGKLTVDDGIPSYKPFVLDSDYENMPTEFSLEFYAKDLYNSNVKQRYLYKVVFGKFAVVEESLAVYRSSRASVLFSRESGKPLRRGGYYKAKTMGLANSLLDNQLYLSVAGNLKDNPLSTIYRYFRDNIRVAVNGSILPQENFVGGLYPVQLRGEHSEFYVRSLSALLRSIDTGIREIRLEKKKKKPKLKFPKMIPDEVREAILNDLAVRPMAVHTKFKDGHEVGVVELDISSESDGTIHFFNFAADMLEALQDGATLIVDELHQSLHPDISRLIVSVFNNKKINTNCAQLLFTSHDLLLLNPALFGRDQVWFTEKNEFGATQLYSLLEFSKDKVRKDTNYCQWYTNGKFGALPNIDYSAFEEVLQIKEARHAQAAKKKH